MVCHKIAALREPLVTEIEPNKRAMIGAIEKRFAYMDEIAREVFGGLRVSDFFVIDRSGYDRLFGLTKGSIGLVMMVLDMIISHVQNNLEEVQRFSPIKINDRFLTETLRLTPEFVEACWENGAHQTSILSVKPWWEL